MEIIETKPIVDREIRSILISQPAPPVGVRSPYDEIVKKHDIKVDFRAFIHVEGVTLKEFRKSRTNPLDFSAIILTSRNSIDHFFRICTELKIKMPQEMKYICSSETVALYLQKFIQYRKRKVSFGNGKSKTLYDLLNKYKSTERFLFPCSNVRKDDIPTYLKENEFDYAEAVFYKTVASDLSDLQNIFYDMIVFFSPTGLKSLFDNFPDFEQNHTRIAAYGESTSKKVEEYNLRLDIKAPAPGTPSMTSAIDQYIKLVNKEK